QVYKHDLGDALQHPIRDRLSHLHAGNTVNHGHQALHVLHVHDGENVDVRVQQVHDVLIALGIFGALDVGVGKFVDQHDLGFARENRLHIHLCEGGAFVVHDAAGNGLQFRGQLCYAFAAVSFNVTDQDIFAAAVAPDALAKHVERLSHTGRITKEELENPFLLLLDLGL